nr:nuclear pore complex protein NUP214 [Tanacetum cinerariifolium]
IADSTSTADGGTWKWHVEWQSKFSILDMIVSAIILNSKPEQPSVSPAVSSPTFSNPVVGVGEEINSSDQAVTQKDDMEVLVLNLIV